MSVATELTKLNTNIKNAYDEIATKGGTVPQNKNTDNLATAISSIPAGTPQVTDSNILITEYTPSTGVIKGQNFGNSGKVYLLDRDTHTYNELTTSSYTDTQVTLSTPIDTTNIVGTTCFYVQPTGKDISNKQMVFGDLPVPGYGILYVQDDDENPTNIRKVTLTQSSDLTYLGGTSSPYKEYTPQSGSASDTLLIQNVVGFQFGTTQSDYISNFNYAFYYAVKFNQPVYFPSWLKSDTTNFLAYSYNFDCPIIFDDNFTKFGSMSNLLSNCKSFNQPLNLSNISATQTPSSLLYQCSKFNQKIEFPSNITKINGNFLNECIKFNQPIEIPNTVTTVNLSFLSYCKNFNQPIELPQLKYIEGGFLSGCENFNQPIEIPNTVISIGYDFLRFCYAFDYPLTIPSSVTKTSGSFLYGCMYYNKPITFEGNSIEIGNGFLQECYAYNQTINFSKFNKIGNDFMVNCYSYSKPITINASSIGTSFLRNCYNIKKITVNSNVTSPTDNNSLGYATNNAQAYQKGITIYGTYRNNILTALPNRTSNPYRNLIDGGS